MAFRGQSHRLDGPASEAFDLVVAGAGLSGLSAAMFYRQRFGSDKRILLLDAMEDFGGHAKRNVFQLQSGKVLIGYGGSESLQSPKSNFSPLVHQLLKDLRVDIDAFPQKYFKQQLFPEMKLSRGSFFDGDKRTLVSGRSKLTSSLPPVVTSSCKCFSQDRLNATLDRPRRARGEERRERRGDRKNRSKMWNEKLDWSERLFS